MSGVRARAESLAYRAGAELARAIPRAPGELLTRYASRLMMASSGTRRRQVERHLQRLSDGQLRGAALQHATRSVFENYGRYWHELFRLAADGLEPLQGHVTADGLEHLDAAMAAGHGAVVAMPHLGNWDVAGAWLAARGYPITAVTEPPERSELFDWFLTTRQRLGIEVVMLGDGAVSAISRSLARNRIVCLAGDRDLTGDGIPVEFFGETTTLPGGPAVLAFRAQAPLIPAGAYYEREPVERDGLGRYRVEFRPPIPTGREGRLRDDVRRVIQDLARVLEQLIRAAPDQWLVLQPNWPSDRGIT